MSSGELLERVHATLLGYLELGHQIEARASFRVTRNERCPDVYDANFASGVRARSADEIDELLADVDRVFAQKRYRQFVLGPETSPSFEARLDLLGYLDKPTLELLLEDELRATPKPFEICRVGSDADWASLARLQRQDDLDGALRERREPYREEVSAQLSAARRAKAPELRFFLARADGVDCAFFSAWPGRNGLGKVEDLFTLPEFRRRGIATALIARAVADARERGAGPVVIGADPNDTPKALYAALGFRPVCVSRMRLWTASPS
jgi:GNAT superfamily N-acetyltransferase